MDPRACLEIAFRAMERSDAEEAYERLIDYDEWVARGGFRVEDARLVLLRAWIVQRLASEDI